MEEDADGTTRYHTEQKSDEARLSHVISFLPANTRDCNSERHAKQPNVDRKVLNDLNEINLQAKTA